MASFDTTQQSALQQIAGTMPVANQRVAQQQQAARDMQLQQAVAATSVPAATAANVQQTATALTQGAGQQQVANVQEAGAQQAAIGQLGLQAKALQDTKDLAFGKLGLQDQTMNNEQKFAQISEQAKQEMFDSRKNFTQDQMGLKFGNERQLADYARLRAGSDEAFKDYTQQTNQLSSRNLQMMQSAYAKLEQQLQYEDARINQAKEQANAMGIRGMQSSANRQIVEKQLEQKIQLQNAMTELQKSIMKKQADAANKAAMTTAIGTVLGAGAGAIIGGSGGAAAGASLGGAAAGLLNSSGGIK